MPVEKPEIAGQMLRLRHAARQGDYHASNVRHTIAIYD